MKRLLTAALTPLFAPLLALCLSQTVQAGVKIEHWTTPSGARVQFVESKVLPMLDVQVDFSAGSMFDPDGKAGLAALTRAALDLGAGSRDESQIAEQLADLGATLGGGADTDRASVALRTLSDKAKRDIALSILRDVLHQPRFDAAIFEREKARTIAALKDTLTRPDAIAGKAFWAALYPAHPYGKQATPESVAALSRDDLAAFYRAHYTVGNASITLVGDLSRRDAEQIAERIAQGLPTGRPPELPVMPQALTGQDIRIAHPASQAHVYLGMPAIERGHPDFFPLIVGNYTLGGGGFVSRLMKEVRDKRGYAYSVYSYFAPLKQPGPFQIGLQTQRKQAGDALKLARDILLDFVQNGPTEEELAAAQANLTGSFPLRLDSNKKLLDNVAAIAFYGLPFDYLDQYQDKIRAVTVDDVKAAFSRHIRSDSLITVTVAGE